MRFRTIGAACAALGLWTGAAHATATLLCEITDRSLEFSLQGAVGSIASSVSGLQAEIEIKAAGAEPARKVVFDSDSLVQRWIDGLDLKLWLRVEHDQKTPETDLIIEAKRKSKGVDKYAGNFRLTVEGAKAPRTFAGKVSCSID